MPYQNKQGVWEMEKIASFTVNHLKLKAGLYVSRKDKFGAEVLTTFDIRLTAPNVEPVMNTAEAHTIEHLGATFLRNHPQMKSKIVYFGPMGCRTGFYLLARNLSSENAIKLVRDSFRFISEFNGDIPGATEAECGNDLEHDLESAKKDVLPLLKKLENYTPEMLDYSWHYAEKL